MKSFAKSFVVAIGLLPCLAWSLGPNEGGGSTGVVQKQGPVLHLDLLKAGVDQGLSRGGPLKASDGKISSILFSVGKVPVQIAPVRELLATQELLKKIDQKRAKSPLMTKLLEVSLKNLHFYVVDDFEKYQLYEIQDNIFTSRQEIESQIGALLRFQRESQKTCSLGRV